MFQQSPVQICLKFSLYLLKFFLKYLYLIFLLNALIIIINTLQHCENWPKAVPICAHAEGQTTAAIIMIASLYNRPIHICHVARKEEILIIREAKAKVRWFS